MFKDYVSEEQKLPLFGVGPYMIFAIAVVSLLGQILFGCVWKIGTLSRPWSIVFIIIGSILIAAGVAIWFIGAIRSDMDNSIAKNRLKTDGIYSWVRNPMYSGWWLAISGISFLCHNLCMLILPVINWGILTCWLICTEEKWLLELYGDEYASYKKRVNRLIPWKSKNKYIA
jgi:protein-S-isoprenylcysteine O-methyltransferase Ste14